MSGDIVLTTGKSESKAEIVKWSEMTTMLLSLSPKSESFLGLKAA